MPVTEFEGVQVGTGGDYDVPELDDGVYDATIVDWEARDLPDMTSGKMIPKYIIQWELTELMDENNKHPRLGQFVRIPDGLVNNNVLSNKSQLYAFMKAIGEDPDTAPITVKPMTWLGRQARVVVKNQKRERGKHAGETRPDITDVMPPIKPSSKLRRTSEPGDNNF